MANVKLNKVLARALNAEVSLFFQIWVMGFINRCRFSSPTPHRISYSCLPERYKAAFVLPR